MTFLSITAYPVRRTDERTLESRYRRAASAQRHRAGPDPLTASVASMRGVASWCQAGLMRRPQGHAPAWHGRDARFDVAGGGCARRGCNGGCREARPPVVHGARSVARPNGCRAGLPRMGSVTGMVARLKRLHCDARGPRTDGICRLLRASARSLTLGQETFSPRQGPW